MKGLNAAVEEATTSACHLIAFVSNGMITGTKRLRVSVSPAVKEPVSGTQDELAHGNDPVHHSQQCEFGVQLVGRGSGTFDPSSALSTMAFAVSMEAAVGNVIKVAAQSSSQNAMWEVTGGHGVGVHAQQKFCQQVTQPDYKSQVSIGICLRVAPDNYEFLTALRTYVECLHNACGAVHSFSFRCPPLDGEEDSSLSITLWQTDATLAARTQTNYEYLATRSLKRLATGSDSEAKDLQEAALGLIKPVVVTKSVVVPRVHAGHRVSDMEETVGLTITAVAGEPITSFESSKKDGNILFRVYDDTKPWISTTHSDGCEQNDVIARAIKNIHLRPRGSNLGAALGTKTWQDCEIVQDSMGPVGLRVNVQTQKSEETAFVVPPILVTIFIKPNRNGVSTTCVDSMDSILMGVGLNSFCLPSEFRTCLQQTLTDTASAALSQIELPVQPRVAAAVSATSFPGPCQLDAEDDSNPHVTGNDSDSAIGDSESENDSSGKSESDNTIVQVEVHGDAEADPLTISAPVGPVVARTQAMPVQDPDRDPSRSLEKLLPIIAESITSIVMLSSYDQQQRVVLSAGLQMADEHSIKEAIASQLWRNIESAKERVVFTVERNNRIFREYAEEQAAAASDAAASASESAAGAQREAAAMQGN